MNLTKRFVAPFATTAGLAFAICLAGCSASQSGTLPPEDVVTYHAEYAAYNTLDEMERSADLIATVVLTGESRTYELLPVPPENPTDPVENPMFGAPGGEVPIDQALPIVVTAFEVRIVDVLKGSAVPGQFIEIKQLGGIAGGTDHVAPDEPSLEQQESALVFLQAWEDEPFSLLNPNDALLPENEVSGLYAPLPASEVEVSEQDVEQFVTDLQN